MGTTTLTANSYTAYQRVTTSCKEKTTKENEQKQGSTGTIHAINSTMDSQHYSSRTRLLQGTKMDMISKNAATSHCKYANKAHHNKATYSSNTRIPQTTASVESKARSYTVTTYSYHAAAYSDKERNNSQTHKQAN